MGEQDHALTDTEKIDMCCDVDEDSDEEQSRNSEHMFQLAYSQYAEVISRTDSLLCLSRELSLLQLLRQGENAIFPCMNPRKLSEAEIRFRMVRLLRVHAEEIKQRVRGMIVGDLDS